AQRRLRRGVHRSAVCRRADRVFQGARQEDGARMSGGTTPIACLGPASSRARPAGVAWIAAVAIALLGSTARPAIAAGSGDDGPDPAASGSSGSSGGSDSAKAGPLLRVPIEAGAPQVNAAAS